MEKNRLFTLGAGICALFLLFAASDAPACTVCYNPGTGTQVSNAVNGMIFVMLGFLGAVFVGFAFFIFHLVRKANAPVPDHVILTESIENEETEHA